MIAERRQHIQFMDVTFNPPSLDLDLRESMDGQSYRGVPSQNSQGWKDESVESVQVLRESGCSGEHTQGGCFIPVIVQVFMLLSQGQSQ